MSRALVSCVLVLAGVAAEVAGGRVALAQAPATQPATQPAPAPATRPAAERPTELWVGLPSAQWPPLVLTNYARFTMQRQLQGASALLLQLDDGRILAATTKHLLGAAGGLNPEAHLVNLHQMLLLWELRHRAAPRRFVTVDKLAITLERETTHDWLAFTLRTTANLPATPLKVRPEPVTKDEPVYLVAAPAADRKGVQQVYPGKVVRLEPGRFAVEIHPPVDTRGFDGAPVIDVKGYLVGAFRGYYERADDGTSKEIEVQDVPSLLSVLEVK